MFKKVIALTALMSVLGGSSLTSYANEVNTYSPETGELPYQGVEMELSPTVYNVESRAKTHKYNATFKNYAQTDKFTSTGRHNIVDGYQKTKTATAKTGVQYQIISPDGKKIAFKETRTGVYNGNLNMTLYTYSGSEFRLRLANAYNLSFNDQYAPTQSASGTFNYLY